jgi:uncharacterized membrane protein YjgN (DUF898 family)
MSVFFPQTPTCQLSTSAETELTWEQATTINSVLQRMMVYHFTLICIHVCMLRGGPILLCNSYAHVAKHNYFCNKSLLEHQSSYFSSSYLRTKMTEKVCAIHEVTIRQLHLWSPLFHPLKGLCQSPTSRLHQEGYYKSCRSDKVFW